jgi:two-component system OmpR family response regulator
MASCYARPMSDAEPPKRLLVVEDEAHLAAGLKLNLELDGYNVDVAANAKQAAEKLIRVDRYDAIVLDVMLPDVNGFELCQRLRDAGNFVPVIMLTARSSPDDRVRGLEAGADDYMVKPFELAELLARVRARCCAAASGRPTAGCGPWTRPPSSSAGCAWTSTPTRSRLVTSRSS